jgi:hypothetical protein
MTKNNLLKYIYFLKKDLDRASVAIATPNLEEVRSCKPA